MSNIQRSIIKITNDIQLKEYFEIEEKDEINVIHLDRPKKTDEFYRLNIFDVDATNSTRFQIDDICICTLVINVNESTMESAKTYININKLIPIKISEYAVFDISNERDFNNSIGSNNNFGYDRNEYVSFCRNNVGIYVIACRSNLCYISTDLKNAENTNISALKLLSNVIQNKTTKPQNQDNRIEFHDDGGYMNGGYIRIYIDNKLWGAMGYDDEEDPVGYYFFWNGPISVNGLNTSEVLSNLVPSENNTYNLGSRTKSFKNAYLVGDGLKFQSKTKTREDGTPEAVKSIVLDRENAIKIMYPNSNGRAAIKADDNSNYAYKNSLKLYYPPNNTMTSDISAIEISQGRIIFNGSIENIKSKYNEGLSIDPNYCHIKFDGDGLNNRIVTQSTLEIVPDTNYDFIENADNYFDTVSFDRIKLGGYENVNGTNVTNVIFTYKQANEENNAIPKFAITRAGDVYYKGKEIATKKELNDTIANLINNSPEALNTLNELAKALGDDPNFATTITNLITAKNNTSIKQIILNGTEMIAMFGDGTTQTLSSATTDAELDEIIEGAWT